MGYRCNTVQFLQMYLKTFCAHNRLAVVKHLNAHYDSNRIYNIKCWPIGASGDHLALIRLWDHKSFDSSWCTFSTIKWTSSTHQFGVELNSSFCSWYRYNGWTTSSLILVYRCILQQLCKVWHGCLAMHSNDNSGCGSELGDHLCHPYA